MTKKSGLAARFFLPGESSSTTGRSGSALRRGRRGRRGGRCGGRSLGGRGSRCSGRRGGLGWCGRRRGGFYGGLRRGLLHRFLLGGLALLGRLAGLGRIGLGRRSGLGRDFRLGCGCGGSRGRGCRGGRSSWRGLDGLGCRRGWISGRDCGRQTQRGKDEDKARSSSADHFCSVRSGWPMTGQEPLLCSSPPPGESQSAPHALAPHQADALIPPPDARRRTLRASFPD